MESIDDKEDMLFADEAFDILGFTKEEKYNIYKVHKLFPGFNIIAKITLFILNTIDWYIPFFSLVKT